MDARNKPRAHQRGDPTLLRYNRRVTEECLIGILFHYATVKEIAREIFARLRPEYFTENRRLFYQVALDSLTEGIWPPEHGLVRIKLTEEPYNLSPSEAKKPFELSAEVVTPEIYPHYLNLLVDHVWKAKLKIAVEEVDPQNPEALEKLSQELDELRDLKLEGSPTLETIPLVDRGNPQPVDWLIEGLLPRHYISILAGKRASFKSWIALSMGFAIARGEDLFGQFPTNQGKVLIIDEELGRDRLYRRAWKLAQAQGWPPEDALRVSSLRGFSFADEEKLLALERLLEKFAPDLVVFDVLAATLGAIEENEAGAVRDIFARKILPLAEQSGAHFLFIHHLRKGLAGRTSNDMLDEFRGSSEFVNIADSAFAVKAKEGGNVVFKHLKGREGSLGEPFLLKVEEDENGALRLEYAGSAVESEAAAESCRASMIEWFNEHPHEPMKRAVIDEAMKSRGHSKRTVSRVLNKLLDDGTLSRPKWGFYLYHQAGELGQKLGQAWPSSQLDLTGNPKEKDDGNLAKS